MSDPYVTAEAAIESLETFASQVEDGERNGDLAALLIGLALACSVLAVADALRHHSLTMTAYQVTP